MKRFRFETLMIEPLTASAPFGKILTPHRHA
jgi:hypothetical protein